MVITRRYTRLVDHSLDHCAVPLAASNIFLRPSIPDMASTFFLQSLTSTVFSCSTHTHQFATFRFLHNLCLKQDAQSSSDHYPTFSVSSFLTDFRFALRSNDTLCLDPKRERRMASADTRTLLRLGRLNFPLKSKTLMVRSFICIKEGQM